MQIGLPEDEVQSGVLARRGQRVPREPHSCSRVKNLGRCLLQRLLTAHFAALHPWSPSRVSGAPPHVPVRLRQGEVEAQGGCWG